MDVTLIFLGVAVVVLLFVLNSNSSSKEPSKDIQLNANPDNVRKKTETIHANAEQLAARQGAAVLEDAGNQLPQRLDEAKNLKDQAYVMAVQTNRIMAAKQNAEALTLYHQLITARISQRLIVASYAQEKRLRLEAKAAGLSYEIYIKQLEKHALNTVDLEKLRAEKEEHIKGVLALRMADNRQWLEANNILEKLYLKEEEIRTEHQGQLQERLLGQNKKMIKEQENLCDGLAGILLKGVIKEDLEGSDGDTEPEILAGEDGQAGPDAE